MKSLKYLLAAGIAGAFVQLASAASLPGPLVTPQWLHEHRNEVTVVDIRDDVDTLTRAPKFEVDKKSGAKKLVETGGHLAGALSVDFGKIRQNKMIDGKKIVAQLPSAEYFTKVMDDAGLNSGKPIVIVPTGATVDTMDMATRLYFQLRYFGEPRDQVAILNGGVNAWLQAGLPVSTAKVMAAKGDWKATGEDQEILATIGQVKEGLRSGANQFVDARPTAQYLGIVVKRPVDAAGGHLAGARSFPTDAIVKPVGAAHEFMSASDYRKIYAEFNIQANAPTITYCNTGHLASGAWFVDHEILGNPKTRLYTGSMTEWTNLGNPTVGLPN
jgi:thiosulfate/3-mercaptopyruvate sulfurtransferase